MGFSAVIGRGNGDVSGILRLRADARDLKFERLEGGDNGVFVCWMMVGVEVVGMRVRFARVRMMLFLLGRWFTGLICLICF